MRQAGGAKTGNASKKPYVTSAVFTDNSFQFSLYNNTGLVTVLGSDGYTASDDLLEFLMRSQLFIWHGAGKHIV